MKNEKKLFDSVLDFALFFKYDKGSRTANDVSNIVALDNFIVDIIKANPELGNVSNLYDDIDIDDIEDDDYKDNSYYNQLFNDIVDYIIRFKWASHQNDRIIKIHNYIAEKIKENPEIIEL